MTTSRRSASSRLAQQTAGLAMAAPQVVGHRLTRMAMAGPQPSARDRAEFHRMGAEKVVAFSQGWLALNTSLWQAQQQLMLQWLQMAWQPQLWWGGAAFTRSARSAAQLGLGALSAGVAPIHQRAVANAKRLATTPLIEPAAPARQRSTRSKTAATRATTAARKAAAPKPSRSR